jgi:membrane protease YdiL (CAAX protease family)
MILAHVRVEFAILASCGPTLAALATNRVAYGNYRAFRFNVNWPRTVGATALGVFLVLASVIVFPAVGVVDAGKLNWSALFALGTYNYSTLLGGPLPEEPGWRGFALPRLQSRFHPVVASVVLGTLWAAWHLPFFLYPGWSQCPIETYFLLLIALSILMTFVTNLARFGVIAPIAMHAVFNTSGRYFQGLFAQTNPGDGGLLNNLFHLIPMAERWGPGIHISFVTLVTIGAWSAAILLIAFTKGRLGYSSALGLSFSCGNIVDNKEHEPS